MADKYENKSLPNVKVLKDIRLKSKPIHAGTVMAKADFPEKQDWLNLLHMPIPRLEETDEKVGAPKKAAKAELPS